MLLGVHTLAQLVVQLNTQIIQLVAQLIVQLAIWIVVRIVIRLVTVDLVCSSVSSDIPVLQLVNHLDSIAFSDWVIIPVIQLVIQLATRFFLFVHLQVIPLVVQLISSH